MNKIILFATLLLIVGCKKDDNKDKDNNGSNEISGLISEYKFDGNTNDAKGLSNGQGTNITYVNDRKGNKNSAIKFTGNSSSGVVIPAKNEYYNDNFTFNLWFNVEENPTHGSAYYFMAFGSPGADHNIMFSNYYGSTNGVCGGSTNNPSTNSPHTLVVTSNMPTYNKWHMLTMTRDNDNLKLYLDGNLISTTNVGGTKPKYNKNSSDVLTIGNRNGNFLTKGSIDDVKYFNRAITESEVKSLFNN